MCLSRLRLQWPFADNPSRRPASEQPPILLSANLSTTCGRGENVIDVRSNSPVQWKSTVCLTSHSHHFIAMNSDQRGIPAQLSPTFIRYYHEACGWDQRLLALTRNILIAALAAVQTVTFSASLARLQSLQATTLLPRNCGCCSKHLLSNV